MASVTEPVLTQISDVDVVVKDRSSIPGVR